MVKATRTPIVVVEDNPGVAMLLQAELFRARQYLARFGIAWNTPQICPSSRAVLDWLGKQQNEAVYLIMADYAIHGGHSSLNLLPQIRQHQALHAQAKIIGWSAHQDVSNEFRAAGADGFISKHLPTTEIVNNIIRILSDLASGQSWVSLDS